MTKTWCRARCVYTLDIEVAKRPITGGPPRTTAKGRMGQLSEYCLNCKVVGVIALLDYGSGNLRSVHKALVKVGASVNLVTRPEELAKVRAAVLPGVGAFDDCMQALKKQELTQATRQFIESGRLFLGICVGYQALFERSEEFSSSMPGLNVFEGTVVRFSPAAGLKIPQIGWNRLERLRSDCPLFKGVPEGSYAYFVHSYFPRPADKSIIATKPATANGSHRRSGATTCLPRSFIRRKASRLGCAC